VPAISIAVMAYFGYNAFEGRLGIKAKAELEKQAVLLKEELARLRQKKSTLSTRVDLLRTGSLERDMLDEQARYHLNLTHQDEIVIFKQR